MSDLPQMPPPPSPEDRLDSWKEIAGYLRRDVTTVQRWEKREGMPVHRHVHDKLGSVYAFKAELDAWARRRRAVQATDAESESEASPSTPAGSPPESGRRWSLPFAIAAGVVLVAIAVWLLRNGQASADNPL